MNYYYGDYDLPVILQTPYFNFEKHTTLRPYKFSKEYVYKNFVISKRKMLYVITNGHEQSIAYNLLLYYNESLKDAYFQFKKFIINLRPEEEKLWLEEKERRDEFDKVDFERDTEVIKYNELDVRVTYYLARLVHRLFTAEPKTLPRYAIEQFVDRKLDTVEFKFPNDDVRLKVLHALLYLYKGGIFETLRAGILRR